MPDAFGAILCLHSCIPFGVSLSIGVGGVGGVGGVSSVGGGTRYNSPTSYNSCCSYVDAIACNGQFSVSVLSGAFGVVGRFGANTSRKSRTVSFCAPRRYVGTAPLGGVADHPRMASYGPSVAHEGH